MSTPELTRRTVFTAAAALAAVPAAALAATAETTPIARLWAKAEAMGKELAAYRAEIEAAAANGGISGWMRLGGKANALGEERYQALVAIMNETPRSQADLAIMGKVVMDDEMTLGPRGWAGEKLASATVALFAA